jgi:hypothetical protein
MGSQKVPEVTVSHWRGRTYGKAYLITFKIESLHIHTLAASILPFLEAPVEGFFENLPQFGRHIARERTRALKPN